MLVNNSPKIVEFSSGFLVKDIILFSGFLMPKPSLRPSKASRLGKPSNSPSNYKASLNRYFSSSLIFFLKIEKDGCAYLRHCFI